MASVPHYLCLPNEKCPVCDVLPFHLLSLDETPAPAVLRLEELDIAAIERFAPKCDLCKLTFDLYDHWRSDLHDEPMRDEGVRYLEVCGKSALMIQHPGESRGFYLVADFGTFQLRQYHFLLAHRS
jgi:hypothetical protein